MRRGTQRLGSFCTGYGGLDLAVGQVFDVQHMWHAEIDPDASKVLAAHWPDVPNHGDLTAVDWAAVEPVSILTAGYPCQPVSAAGKRRGTNDERWIWPDVFAAVRVLRPQLVVLENVAGHLSLGFGRVLGDLASAGFDAEWGCVRASDVGAPHRRARVFIVAWPADSDRDAVRQQPVPVAGCGGAALARGSGPGVCLVSLLPTPAARLGERWGQPNAETGHRRMYDEGRRNLEDAVALLPTPTVADAEGARNATANRTAVKPSTNDAGWTLSDVAHAARWGEYGLAIARWEHVTGRPAPEPTETGTKGQPRLAPPFVEWLMGLPAGWVTDHLPRNAALRVLGNGVVPQQAAYAVADLAGVAS